MREFVNQTDQAAVMDFIVACFDSFIQTDELSSEGFQPSSWHPFSPSGLATWCNIYLSLCAVSLVTHTASA